MLGILIFMLAVGTISGKIIACGDVNCDGSVNMGDVIALLYYIGYGDPICCELAADVNGDGSIDVGDVVELMYSIGGL